MLTLMMIIAAVMLVLFRHGQLPIGQAMHRWLVEKPATRLNSLDRRHVILLILIAIILATGGELLAAAGPIDLSMILLWDVSVYLDAAILSITLASAARSVAAGRYLKAVAARRLTRAGHVRRPRRTRHDKPSAPTANDDDRSVQTCAA
jgi:hypothetical protein